MRRDEQIKVVRRLMDRIDKGENVDAGGIMYNPVETYTCPKRAELEWETFFKHHPQVIGLSGDLLKPGDFFTLNDFGIPILATRDEKGCFRAFANVCRHRGAIVETEKRGHKNRFTCEFHAWTYKNDGQLMGIPRSDHFGKVDKNCHGLIELPSAEKNGLLFVHPEKDGSLNLDQLLAGLSDEFESWGFDKLIYFGEDSYETPMNWKLAIDTFGETYHFGSLHRNSLFPSFHGNVQTYDVFGNNHRMGLCLRSIDDMRRLPEEQWNIHDAVFPVYYLFPNVQVNVSRNGVILVRVYPDRANPHRSFSRISFYFKSDVLEAEPDAIINLSRTFAEIIRDEDYAAAARSHQGAQSGVISHFTFGRNEPPLHHYHNTYRKMLGLDPLPIVDA